MHALTLAEVSEELRVPPDRIRRWILSGELVAFDLRGRGARRASWRIRRPDLEDFLGRRSPKPPSTRERTRRAQHDDRHNLLSDLSTRRSAEKWPPPESPPPGRGPRNNCHAPDYTHHQTTSSESL